MNDPPEVETTENLKKGGNENKTVICVTFLLFSGLLYFGIGKEFRWLVGLLLFIPNSFCAEWLLEQILHPKSRLSVQNSGFSVKRIVVGVIFALLFLSTWIFLLDRVG